MCANGVGRRVQNLPSLGE